MSKPLTYKPFAGLEFAFSPELVDAMYDKEHGSEDVVQDLDLSGLRPVHVVERANTFRRGKHLFTTHTTIYTNRPVHTNTNPQGAQQ